MVLSVATLGIYGNVVFFQCARQYQAAAPGTGKSFDLYFWLYIGLWLPTIVFLIGFLPVGIILLIGQIIAGHLALGEMLDARTAVVAQNSLNVQLTSSEALKGYWLFGNFLGLFLCVGIIPLIIQAVKLFEDHNRISSVLTPA